MSIFSKEQETTLIVQTTLIQKTVAKLEKNINLSPYAKQKLIHNPMIRLVQSGTVADMKNLLAIADAWQIPFDPSSIVTPWTLPDDFVDPFVDEENPKNIEYVSLILSNVPTGGSEIMGKHCGNSNICRTFLHEAASQLGIDGTEKVRILLSRGADAKRVDENLWLPVCYAADIGNVASVKALVKANPETGDNLANPPYIIASMSRLGKPQDILEILEIFQKLGANPNVTPNDKWSYNRYYCSENALTAAVKSQSLDRVKLILSNPKTNPNEQRKYKNNNNSALNLALSLDECEIALLIIDHPKFNPNVNPVLVMPYLHQAVNIGAVEIVKTLIAKEANSSLRYGKLTPLELAKLRLKNAQTKDERSSYEAIRDILQHSQELSTARAVQ